MIDSLVVVAIAVYVIAGFVKGTVGIGLPAAAISLFAQASGDTRLAIALVIVPMVVLNAWQCWRANQVLQVLRRYRVLCVVMVLSIGVASLGAVHLSTSAVTLFLGLVITLFAATSLWREWPELPRRWDRAAQVVTGLVCGVLGGVSGVWAPPLVVYLSALRVDKEAFVAATGVFLLFGSVVIALSYSANGLLSAKQAGVGALLVMPALLGYWWGERLRERLSGPGFRRALLIVFLLIGLNLVRRALFA